MTELKVANNRCSYLREEGSNYRCKLKEDHEGSPKTCFFQFGTKDRYIP